MFTFTARCIFIFILKYFQVTKRRHLPPVVPLQVVSERPRLPVPPPRRDPRGRPRLAPLGGCLRLDLPSISYENEAENKREKNLNLIAEPSAFHSTIN